MTPRIIVLAWFFFLLPAGGTPSWSSTPFASQPTPQLLGPFDSAKDCLAVANEIAPKTVKYGDYTCNVYGNCRYIVPRALPCEQHRDDFRMMPATPQGDLKR
jgi:hypothetical protein